MLTTRHPVDFPYTHPELEALFQYARAHDVERGGRYDARSACILLWSHHWLNDATREESETIGSFYVRVKPRHEAKQAHQALIQAAKRLTQEALHTPLPKGAEQAIAAGKPWQDTVKAATLELTRDDWPTGKGYTLDFLVRPIQ